jgi:dephospho-CoA kinase
MGRQLGGMRAVDRVKTIGLIGGIGSGKSLVAEMLGELGALVLDADKMGHAILADDPDVRDAVRRRWGEAVFPAEGGVDRRAIARRVFGDGPAALDDRRFLEGQLHPRIRRRLEAERDSAAAESKGRAVVVDAALLFEAGWNDACDLVVFIDAPRDMRLQRARQRGWSDEEFAAREAAQWPVEEKRRRSNVVIPNDDSREDLRRAVQAFWAQHIAR